MKIDDDNGYDDITNRPNDRGRRRIFLEGLMTKYHERMARGCTQKDGCADGAKSTAGYGMMNGDHRELQIHDYRPIQFDSHSLRPQCSTCDFDEYDGKDHEKNERGCTRDECNKPRIKIRHPLNAKSVRGCTRNRSVTEDNANGRHLGRTSMTRTFYTMLFVLRIGTMYLWVLQVMLCIGSRLLFLHAETGYANTGTELGWQIMRGFGWALATFGYIYNSRSIVPKRRLQMVQQRRLSLGVRPRQRSKMTYALMACMVLNTHAVAVIQHAPFGEGDISRNDTVDDANLRSCSLGRQRLSSNCGDRQRLQVYGHHAILGACGPRYANVERRYTTDISDEACQVWRDFEEGLGCRATLTRPQPNLDPDRATYVASLGSDETHGIVILVDIDLHGGVPRRHTISLSKREAARNIIRKVDRDRRCFPNGVAPCVVRHGSKTYYDFEDYEPREADYIEVIEEEYEIVSDEDLTSFQQLSLSVTVQPYVFPQEIRLTPDDIQDTCLLDEVVYDFPEDENDFVELPPRHIWLNPIRSAAAIQLAIHQHQDRAKLDSYGLREVYIGNRVTQVTHADPHGLLQIIVHLWAEYAIGSHMLIFEANPQPFNTPPATRVILVEFPAPGRDHTYYYRSVILDVFVDGDAEDRRTAYLPGDCSVRDVAETLEKEGACWPQGLDDCYVLHGNSQYDAPDRFVVTSGSYIVFRMTTFNERMTMLRHVFPDAQQYARDFLWRAHHYSRDEFTIVVHATTGIRDEPREILRTRNNFRYADELWQEAVDLWRTNGATDASVLQVIWPQNTYHSGPQYLHMVLDITPNFPWFPVLVSIFVRLGREPPRRIELQSWQVPRTMSVRHLAALVGFSGFLTDHVEDVYVAYGTTRFNGVEAMIQTQRGGHYELFLQTASLNTFIIAVARQLHLRDLEPAGDTSTNQEMTSVPEGRHEEEEEDSLLQVFNSPILETQTPWDTVLMARNDGDALDDDLTLVQTSLVIGVVVHIAESSFTEIFLERVWPMTEDGERQLAMDTDVVQLRTDWSRVRSVYGIPRPVDVATFIISRPFEIGSRAPGLQLSIARFDDPLSVPEEIMSHWPELRNGEWRIFPGHESLRSARTVDVDGWHFVLLTPQFNNYPNFAAGFIEVVSRFQEDEHSVLLTVVLPVRSTWTHLWSWLRLGDLYFGRNLFQVFHNGVPQTMTHLAYSLSHGFFIQIVAHAYTETDFAPIPGARIRSWMRDFRLTSPSQYGYVFRAGASIDDTLCVRLPRQDRDWEILQQWLDLTVWTSCRANPAARNRGPPWSPDDDVHIVQSHPDGTNVPILCSVYEGGGAVDYAIVIYRYSSIFALHQILRCAARCASEEYECHTHHNGILIPPHEILNLDEGDYLEVFLLAKSSNAHPLSQAVGDTHPVDQHSGTTATSTWSLVGLSSPGGDIGCRPHLVSWLNNADRDMFCGANTSSPRQSMYTRSFVIFRHALWTSCIHPMLTGDPSLVHSPPHLELDLSQKITSYVPLCSEMTIEIAVSTQERIDRRLGFDVVQDVTSHVLDRWCKSRQVLHRAQFSGQLEDEVDHLSLMQIGSVTPPTVSSIPTTVSVRLVGLRGLSARVEVDPTLTLTEQMEAVWPFNHVSPDAVYMYHPVSEPPAYTSEPQEQLFIVQLQNDHFSQIHEDDVLTLVIIRFLAPNAPFDNSKQRARVLWTPSQATRTSLLQFLRANWICRRPTTLCHVFVNRVLWPEMDTASRSIEPGDYIRLQVKTERAQFCDLILAETNARRQRIWESSSEKSQPPDDFASEESESEEQSRYPRRSRSRSRERPRRNQRGGSSSLLQVSMIRLNKRTLDDYPQKDFDAIAAFDDVCEASSHPIATATLLRTTFTTTSDSPLWRLATPKIAWVFAVLQVRVLTCLSTLAGSASCWHPHPSFSNTDVPEDGNGPVHWLGVVPEALFGGSYSGYVLERQYMRSLSDISWYAPCASGDPPIWDVDAIFAELPSCDIRTDCWIRDSPNCPWNGNRVRLDDNEAPIFGIGDMRPDACGQPCAVHGKVLPYYLSLNASFAYLRPPGNGP